MAIYLLLLVVCCLLSVVVCGDTDNGMAWHGMAWHGMAWHGMAVNKNPSPLSVGIDKGEGFFGVWCDMEQFDVLLFVGTRARAQQSCVVKKFAATRQRKQ